MKTQGAVPVLVSDVGAVREGAAIKRGEGSHNAHPAVILGIQKQPGVNTLELTRRIELALHDIQRSLPPGMRIHRDPIRPTSWQLQDHGKSFPPSYLHSSWRDYLYWDVELDT